MKMDYCGSNQPVIGTHPAHDLPAAKPPGGRAAIGGLG